MTFEASRVTAEYLDMLAVVERASIIEADDSFLGQVRAYAEAPIAGLVPQAQKFAERGAHQLASALSAYDKADDPKLWRDYLDASYAEMFLGVTPQATIPVESCYLHDERVLYASEFFEVKEFMEQVSFVVPANYHEPPDHFAAEFALLGHLLRAGDFERADAFKRDHMDTWVHRACSDMIDRDDVGFYTGIANLAKAALYQLD